MKEKLFLFTSRFPYGKAEGFIEPELKILARYYKEIHIFPLLKDQMFLKREIPVNVVIHNPIEIESINGISLLRLKFMLIFFKEFFKSNKKKQFVSDLKINLRTLVQCYHRSKRLAAEFEFEMQSSDLYVFWMEDWATTMSFARQRNHRIKFLCRVHGFDLYDHRQPKGYIPWRYFQLENCSKVVAVSLDGQNYIKQKFPKFASKMELSHLGTAGNFSINLPAGEQTFTVVSCSAIIPLKRVTLIAELLSKSSIALEWIHFGDGIDLPVLQKIIGSSSFPKISVRLVGTVNRNEILDFYSNNSIDLFIHLSESEGGVPLSIQEALSFGIPVLACDAGGVREIVNDQTGKLLPVNIDSIEFNLAIHHMRNACSRNLLFRSGAQKFWKENFDLEKSTQKLIGIFDSIKH
jgi:glycosyltransferase involved in cell wall biosynthesis